MNFTFAVLLDISLLSEEFATLFKYLWSGKRVIYTPVSIFHRERVRSEHFSSRLDSTNYSNTSLSTNTFCDVLLYFVLHLSVYVQDTMLKAVWSLYDRFKGFKQQDAQEFCLFVLNQLSKEQPLQSEGNSKKRNVKSIKGREKKSSKVRISAHLPAVHLLDHRGRTLMLSSSVFSLFCFSL